LQEVLAADEPVFVSLDDKIGHSSVGKEIHPSGSLNSILIELLNR
jgi:hypothetical protein